MERDGEPPREVDTATRLPRDNRKCGFGRRRQAWSSHGDLQRQAASDARAPRRHGTSLRCPFAPRRTTRWRVDLRVLARGARTPAGGKDDDDDDDLGRGRNRERRRESETTGVAHCPRRSWSFAPRRR